MATFVTGNVKDLGVANASGAEVRFWLRGTAGNQPRVNGEALIAPTQGGIYFLTLVCAADGSVSGTLYSTRDSAGTGDGDIEVGGTKTAVWYGMQVFIGGKAGPEVPVHARSGATLDISTVIPIMTTPVSTAPTGEATYGPLGGGNQPSMVLLIKELEETRLADQFPGADAGEKISAAISDLPAAGGVVDARALTGSQIVSGNPFPAGGIAPVTVLLGAGTYTCGSAWDQLAHSNFSLIGLGRDKTIVAFNPVSNSDDFIKIVSQSAITFEGIGFTGTNKTTRCIFASAGSSNISIRNCSFSGFSRAAAANSSAPLYFIRCTDIAIEDNIFTTNAPGMDTDSGCMIFTSDGSAGCSRVRIVSNRIYSNTCLNAISLYDILDAIVIDNFIDQNNKIGSDLAFGGYGVLCYGLNFASTTIRRIIISHNVIQNTAGMGIYVVNTDGGDITVANNLLLDVVKQQTRGSLLHGGIAVSRIPRLVTITGNTVRTSTKSGIALQGCVGGTIASNSIYDVADNGIHLSGNPEALGSIAIQGNTIDDAAVGIMMTVGRMSNSSICGNAISSTRSHGMFFVHLSKSTISGNSLQSLGGRGIQIKNASNAGDGIVVSDNQITTTGTDGIVLEMNTVACLIANNTLSGITGTAIESDGTRNRIQSNVFNGAGKAIDTSCGTSSHLGDNDARSGTITNPDTYNSSDVLDY